MHLVAAITSSVLSVSPHVPYYHHYSYAILIVIIIIVTAISPYILMSSLSLPHVPHYYHTCFIATALCILSLSPYVPYPHCPICLIPITSYTPSPSPHAAQTHHLTYPVTRAPCSLDPSLHVPHCLLSVALPSNTHAIHLYVGPKQLAPPRI